MITQDDNKNKPQKSVILKQVYDIDYLHIYKIDLLTTGPNFKQSFMLKVKQYHYRPGQALRFP